MPEREDRLKLEAWVAQQKTLPNRKTAQKTWPGIPQKIVRAVLSSEKARRGE